MYMKKLLYTILIAFVVTACVEKDATSPATTSAPGNPENLRTQKGPDDLEPGEEQAIKALAKTPITQAEFDQIIANAPPGEPIVIKRRSGTALEIGQLYAPAVHPELLHFEFVECEFTHGIYVQNTFQALLNMRRCIMPTFMLQTSGVVQYVEIKRSKINELKTIDGGRVSGLTLTKSKILHIQHDLGGGDGFQFIHFEQ